MPKEGKGKTHKRKLKMIAKRNEPRATNLSVVFKNDDCQLNWQKLEQATHYFEIEFSYQNHSLCFNLNSTMLHYNLTTYSYLFLRCECFFYCLSSLMKTEIAFADALYKKNSLIKRCNKLGISDDIDKELRSQVSHQLGIYQERYINISLYG